MAGEFMVHIVSTVRGDDNRLVTYNLSFDTEQEADRFTEMLMEAVPKGGMIKIADDERIRQSNFINAAQILEIRRRHKRAGER
ncbi:MAG: hypothetical protein HRF45_10750 [Fimbriimonadia bacterium]|jgi:hypothetical protein